MKHNKVFFALIILSIVIGAVGSFFRVEVRPVLAIIILLAVFTLTETYNKIVAKYLWSKYCDRADWKYVDGTKYKVTLDVFGYSFFGYGDNSADDKEINYIACACPDGKVVVIV